MKTKVLFSALAIASLFAACNNEDVLTNEENTQFENAKLLGKGLSLNLTNGAVDTRVADGAWEAGDKAGLAWVAGESSTAEDITGVADAPNANHMYIKSNGAAWNTNSNIYEGWHFAYYPFAYQSAPTQLVFDVNAAPMKKAFLDDQYEALHISAADYLDGDKIDGQAGSITTAFRMERVVNILKPILKIDKAFTENADLKDIKIKGIRIYANDGGNNDNKIFQNKLKLVPKKLPTFEYKEGKVDLEAINKKFIDEKIFGDDGALVVVENSADNNIYTSIDEKVADNYKLDGEKELRVFVAPVKKNGLTSVGQLNIKVDVEGGVFDIYANDIVEANQKTMKKLYSLLSGTEDADNNAAKRNFQTVFYNAGTTDAPVYKPQPAQKLELTLNKDNFHPDFSNISNIDEWNAAVKIADALKLEEVTFNLTGDVKFPAGNMNVPSAETLKVTGTQGKNAKMTFAAATNWSGKIAADLPGVLVNVEKDGVLSINSTLGYASVQNNGVIKAGATAKLNTNDGKYINNENGRIIVEYGAFVYPTTDKEGVIAYEVKSTTPAEISRINTLVNGGTKGAANVNTLIVSTTLDINAVAGAAGTDDPYNAGTPATSLTDVSNVNIELVGGSVIKKLEGSNEDVKSITAVSGENTTTDVETTAIATKAGATLTVTSETEPTMTDLALTGDITNAGTLNAETNIACANVTNEVGTINVSAEKTIWYTGTYKQGGTTKGNVLLKKN